MRITEHPGGMFTEPVEVEPVTPLDVLMTVNDDDGPYGEDETPLDAMILAAMVSPYA